MQTERLGGRYFTKEELGLIKEIVELYPGLSQNELAKTICENLLWFEPNGKYKTESCLGILEKLEAQGEIKLPEVRKQKIREGVKISITKRSDLRESLFGSIDQYGALEIRGVEKEELGLWNEYIHRYHYLGYKIPFGLHQRYFIVLDKMQTIGCMLYTVAAWAVECRDKWIGWTYDERYRNLNKIINNSRFLIFPWVKIKNLASKALSLASKRIVQDWKERFGYKPLLIETFVDTRFSGTCYKAAGWHCLGMTKGRGRQDRFNRRPTTFKDVYITILDTNFRKELVQ